MCTHRQRPSIVIEQRVPRREFSLFDRRLEVEDEVADGAIRKQPTVQHQGHRDIFLGLDRPTNRPLEQLKHKQNVNLVQHAKFPTPKNYFKKLWEMLI